MTAFILMGVAGSGKTTVGKRVAETLGLPFFEGDDFHPPENVAKMSSGIPLTDADRVPWIDALVGALNAKQSADAVVACSALSRFVRQHIRNTLKEPATFIWLTGSPEVIEERLRNRGAHYMKAGMLASQFAALQPPSSAHQVSVEQPVAQVVEQVLAIISSVRAAAS
jgi:gluconokinase